MARNNEFELIALLLVTGEKGNRLIGRVLSISIVEAGFALYLTLLPLEPIAMAHLWLFLWIMRGRVTPTLAWSK